MIKASFFTDAHKRVEIPENVCREVFKRVYDATRTERRPEGDLLFMRCEKCHEVIGMKAAQYDHIQPEVFNNTHPNEREPITASDVMRLGQQCCHKDKSIKEVKARAKMDRLARSAAGLPSKKGKIKGRGWNQKLRKKMNGDVVEK